MCCFIVVSNSCMADNAPSGIPVNAKELRAYLEWIRMGSLCVNLNQIEGYTLMLYLVSQSLQFTWNESTTNALRRFEANSGYSLCNFQQGCHHSKSQEINSGQRYETSSSISGSNEADDPPGGIFYHCMDLGNNLFLCFLVSK
jgi:hypothetical protein